MIDPRLFRLPGFTVSLAAYLLATFVAFASFLFIFQYLQLVRGLSALDAALWSVPSFAAFIVGAMVTPLLVRRVRPAYVMSAGTAMAAAGYVLLTQVGESSLALVVLASIVFSLGEAPTFTLATDLIIGSAPPERAGVAAAISETSSELGGALGIAILGTIGAAVYRGQMADAIPPGVPADAAEAARDTLGAAVAAGGQLPDPPSAALVEAAREAFIQGMQAAALASATIAAATAVLVVVGLRHVRAGSQPDPDLAAAS
jgi:DHA2 family multidrug resistance protein-like MFS transporter